MSGLVPLYGCTPAGVGTALVESLTSFVSRLAAARHLSTTDAFEYLVFPRIATSSRPPQANVGQYLGRDAVGLDGVGPRAGAVVGAVEALTGMDGLAQHTLLPWARVLSDRNPGAILRGGKRWCPQCFEGWHRRGVAPWEPLLWRLAPVLRCPVHRTRLVSLCPRCQRPQPAVTKVVPVGRCSWCGAYLHDKPCGSGGADHAVTESEESLREWWTSIAVARMLSVQGEATLRANPDGFSHLLIDAVHRLASGRSKALAQRLGVSYATLHRWASQRTRPRLDYFLAVCMRLGEDPAAVGLYPYGAAFGVPWRAWGHRAAPWPPLASNARHRRVRYGPDFWARVGERFRASLAEDGRRSVTQIARSLGVSVPGLRHHFPEEVESLARRYARRRREERDARFSMQERQLREAVVELARCGEYPSAPRAFAFAGLEVQLSNRRLIAVWRDAQHRAGVSSS